MLRARVVFVGHTSLMVKVTIHSEDMNTGEQLRTTEAFLTFVCLGRDGKPRAVPGLIVESDEEKADYTAAKERRERRLEIHRQEIK